MKNLDYVCKIVAKNNKLPEALVKRVNNFFWKEVNRRVYAHEELSLYIREIGTFVHSMKKIRTEILWLVDRIRIVRRGTKFGPVKKANVENHYVTALRKLWVQHNNLAVLFQEIEKKQKENKLLKNEQINGILEADSESNSQLTSSD